MHSNCLRSRCLHGMLNGNIGVMKSMMAELTDETNMARGFSLIPVTWAVGCTLGFGSSRLSFLLWLMYWLTGPLLGVCYHGHKIVGQMSFRILSGANTHTSYHVSSPLYILSCRFPWLQFS